VKRKAFFISDSTGITAETLGNSLLAQFQTISFEKIIVPYVDSVAKAESVADRINRAAAADGVAPIVLDTIVKEEIRRPISEADGFTIDIFGSFLRPLEAELQAHSSYTVGKTRHREYNAEYENRMEAVHYALDADDGAKLDKYEQADIILVGVSRSGKTPTCLYLALNYGIYAANYPLTEDDFDSHRLPAALLRRQDKLFGLTIQPERLSAIRQERRANSRYASLIQCEDEIRQGEGLFARHGIPVIDTTQISVEEIATRIMDRAGLRRTS